MIKIKKNAALLSIRDSFQKHFTNLKLLNDKVYVNQMLYQVPIKLLWQHKVNACIVYTPTKTSIIWLKTRISHNTLSGCCRQSETDFVFGRAGPSWIPSTESSGWVRHHSPDWSWSSIALGHYCLRVSIVGSRCLWKTPIRSEKREQSRNLLIKNSFSTLANSSSLVIKWSHKVGCESLS